MNCFNHDSVPAIGICKHCNKALCHSCVTDTGAGLACTASCVEVVESLNSLINRNLRTASVPRGNVYLTSIFLGAMGIIFLAFGLSGVPNASFPIAVGTCLVLFASAYAIRTRKWLLITNSNREPDE